MHVLNVFLAAKISELKQYYKGLIYKFNFIPAGYLLY